jgi:hypothetical protein
MPLFDFPYIYVTLQWMQDTFHERLHGKILNPMDPDIATSLGTAQSGLTESLIQRPIGAPAIIASKSYIIGVGPNLAMGRGGNWNLGTAAGMMNGFNGVFEYVLALDNCASPVTWLMSLPCLQERSIWLSKAHC